MASLTRQKGKYYRVFWKFKVSVGPKAGQIIDGSIYLGTEKINKSDITVRVRDLIANRLDKTVFVKSDARAEYGAVVAVVDEVRAAGVDQLGLLTERVEQQRRPGLPPPTGGID